jgi:hypothetical protein
MGVSGVKNLAHGTGEISSRSKVSHNDDISRQFQGQKSRTMELSVRSSGQKSRTRAALVPRSKASHKGTVRCQKSRTRDCPSGVKSLAHGTGLLSGVKSLAHGIGAARPKSKVSHMGRAADIFVISVKSIAGECLNLCWKLIFVHHWGPGPVHCSQHDQN